LYLLFLVTATNSLYDFVFAKCFAYDLNGNTT